jgi:hypothetical protein
MFKMKNISCFLLIVIAGITSCNKLNETAYSQITTDNFFTTKNDVDAALTAMYRPIQQCCGGYEQSANFVLNATSDEGTSSNSTWGQYDNLTYTPGSSGDVHDIWVANYQSISSANYVLDNEKKIASLDPDPTYAMAKLAEARFIRGMDYFELVQMFGDVPLRTTLTSRADQVDIPRTSADSVYAQIIADFTYAEANLPVAASATGHPTKFAATSFLAKVYLTMKDYQNALTKSEDVRDNGPYGLLPNFADIFDVDNKDNKEVIFDIQYIRQDGQGMRMEYLVLGPDNLFAAGATGGWGLSNVENGVINHYNPVDSRIATTFADPSPGLTTYYIGKWRDVKGVSADGHGNNYIVYRYADLLLEVAEAENEVNGPTIVAYNSINTVRTRANLPGLTTGLTQDQFRDSVLWERHLELNWEEWRWFDLKRTGKLKETLIADGKTWNDRYLLFPIPQSEIDASNKKIVQNPGY